MDAPRGNVTNPFASVAAASLFVRQCAGRCVSLVSAKSLHFPTLIYCTDQPGAGSEVVHQFDILQ